MEPSTANAAIRPALHTPRISHWSFDRLVGQINACDERGNLVMTITADPLFGCRLAAAFAAPAPEIRPAQHTPKVTAWRVPAQPPLHAARESWRHAAAVAA